GVVTSYGTGALVHGNIIGLDVSGMAAIPNAGGIFISVSGATIGGTTAAARNVVSGNTGSGINVGVNLTSSNALISAGIGAVIQGNYVGTNSAGTVAVPNTGSGISSSAANDVIGGTAAGARNV